MSFSVVPKTFQIHLTPKEPMERLSRLLAAIFGCWWGEGGNPTELWRRMLRGELLPDINPAPWGDSADQVWGVLEQVLHYHKQQQAFSLTYKHANGDRASYTVRYAEIVKHGSRLYVDAWVEEPDDRQPLALNRNRSFRVERIEEVSTFEAGHWYQLDTLEVVFELRGELANSYEKKPGDRFLLTSQPGTLQVVRSITSLFWFIREILPYGQDCVVLEPEVVREKVSAIVQEMSNNYAGK